MSCHGLQSSSLRKGRSIVHFCIQHTALCDGSCDTVSTETDFGTRRQAHPGGDRMDETADWARTVNPLASDRNPTLPERRSRGSSIPTKCSRNSHRGYSRRSPTVHNCSMTGSIRGASLPAAWRSSPVQAPQECTRPSDTTVRFSPSPFLYPFCAAVPQTGSLCSM
jgi:hypothetical protein